jgi:asparagine synthetase B (glutamine-hydrolysing)
MLHRAADIWDRFASAGTLEQMLAVDRGTALVDEMLAKVDTASMAHCVEARVPFLADAVVAKAKGLSAAEKRVGTEGKKLLRDWFRELGPPGAAARPKTGFNSPVRAWLTGAARDYLREHATQGADLLGMSRLPQNSRLMFALAVLGAWHDRHSRSPATAARLAS